MLENKDKAAKTEGLLGKRKDCYTSISWKRRSFERVSLTYKPRTRHFRRFWDLYGVSRERFYITELPRYSSGKLLSRLSAVRAVYISGRGSVERGDKPDGGTSYYQCGL